MPTSDGTAAQAAKELAPEAPTEEVKEADPVETSARAQGWKPKKEFTGDPALWVDAKEFIGRAPLFEKIKDQSKVLKKMEKTVDAMAKHLTANVQYGVKVELAKLKAAKREAIEGGDVAKVEAIDKQIDETKATKADIPTAPDMSASVKEWGEKNEWFFKDEDLHDAAMIANDLYLKRHPGDVEGALKHVSRTIEKNYADHPLIKKGNPSGSPVPTVEGSTAPASTGKKYTVSRLNADQKLAHDQYIKAGTFDALAKAAKMTPSEYYVHQMDEIGELTK